MTDPLLKLQILARSEMALFRLQARRSATRTVLIAIAMLFALLALAMLNFSGYQALAETKSPAVAALIVALVNGVIALIIVFAARSAGPDEEQEKMVRELRDLAYNELSADFDEVKEGITKVTEDVSRIRSGFSAMTGGSNNLIAALGPLLNMLISAIQKNRKNK